MEAYYDKWPEGAKVAGHAEIFRYGGPCEQLGESYYSGDWSEGVGDFVAEYSSRILVSDCDAGTCEYRDRHQRSDTVRWHRIYYQPDTGRITTYEQVLECGNESVVHRRIHYSDSPKLASLKVAMNIEFADKKPCRCDDEVEQTCKARCNSQMCKDNNKCKDPDGAGCSGWECKLYKEDEL